MFHSSVRVILFYLTMYVITLHFLLLESSSAAGAPRARPLPAPHPSRTSGSQLAHQGATEHL